MAVDEMDQLVTCSMDDTVRYTNLNERDYRLVKILPFYCSIAALIILQQEFC